MARTELRDTHLLAKSQTPGHPPTPGNQWQANQQTGTLGDRTITYTAEGLAARIVAQAGSGAETTSEFRYGAGGRYLRIDQTGASTRTTRYLGSVEWITNSGSQRQELRRTIGGFLIISEERLTPGAASTNRKHQYLFHDHLGSVDVIVEAESLGNVNQGVVDRKSYNAHGERREVPGGTGPWQNLIDPRTQATTNDARTDRGFTGHEHIDRARIVHMNGRLYDPLTGRMLSADPIVQEPFNLQNLNRYSYVLNNPLSYTDPTGLSFVRKYWRQIVQIAAAVLTAGQSLWVTMATSFTVGVAVTGSLRGGLIAAFSAAVFHGIGEHFAGVAAANRAALGETFAGVLGTGLRGAQFATQIAAHAMAGGVISVMQGGKFGHGFVSAGATKAASPWINSIGDGARELAPARVATAALVGGTVSAATGGKFANGAVTAAFQQAWNGERGRALEEEALEPTFEQVLDTELSFGPSRSLLLSAGGAATTNGAEFEVGAHWKFAGAGVEYSSQGADPFFAVGPGAGLNGRGIEFGLRWYQRQGVTVVGQGSVCLPGGACGNAGFELSNISPRAAFNNALSQTRHVFDMLRPRGYQTIYGRPYISNQYYEGRR